MPANDAKSKMLKDQMGSFKSGKAGGRGGKLIAEGGVVLCAEVPGGFINALSPGDPLTESGFLGGPQALDASIPPVLGDMDVVPKCPEVRDTVGGADLSSGSPVPLLRWGPGQIDRGLVPCDDPLLDAPRSRVSVMVGLNDGRVNLDRCSGTRAIPTNIRRQ